MNTNGISLNKDTTISGFLKVNENIDCGGGIALNGSTAFLMT
jgi:hypothetical protein